MKTVNRKTTYRQIAHVTLIFLAVTFTGCNTLSSLGLPLGGSRHPILKSAKQISQTPELSIQAPTELGKVPLDVYIVEIGDTILIEATNFDATIRLPGDQVVQPDGFVSLGECGRLMAMNKTVEQIRDEAQVLIDQHLRQDLEVAFEIERRQRMREAASRDSDDSDSDSDEDDLELNSNIDDEERIALERKIESTIAVNEISVRLVTWDSKKIYVLGEVNSPGSFTFIGNETVLDAIIEAGGLNSKANHHQIVITRPSDCNGCRTVMQVCYDQIVQLGDTSTNYQLRPGDRVFVPSLTFADDLKQSLRINKSDRCPRCADSPRGCNLPMGCSNPAEFSVAPAVALPVEQHLISQQQ